MLATSVVEITLPLHLKHEFSTSSTLTESKCTRTHPTGRKKRRPDNARVTIVLSLNTDCLRWPARERTVGDPPYRLWRAFGAVPRPVNLQSSPLSPVVLIPAKQPVNEQPPSPAATLMQSA
jgi:hypothetical protein